MASTLGRRLSCAAVAPVLAAHLLQQNRAGRTEPVLPPPFALHKRDSKSSSAVSDAEGYIEGIKIWGIGILEDPVPGEKRGKGIQHLTSTYWIYDMGVFIQRNFPQMQLMARYAFERSECAAGAESAENNGGYGFDFLYFINVSNALFLKAEAEGLATRDGRDFFLMACWLAMAAAEVDGFSYGKYSEAERSEHRSSFYRKYLRPQVVWDGAEDDDLDVEAALGKYAIESCRMDLLPSVAMERLGLHNELCALKWSDPAAWMRQGFVVSARFDSMKRHYESLHAQDRTEDHLAHLIWGFMALTHVIAVFPHTNDLVNFEALRRRNVLRYAQAQRAQPSNPNASPPPPRDEAHLYGVPKTTQSSPSSPTSSASPVGAGGTLTSSPVAAVTAAASAEYAAKAAAAAANTAAASAAPATASVPPATSPIPPAAAAAANAAAAGPPASPPLPPTPSPTFMSALEEGEPILDVVGDGGFRASVPGKGRQSGHSIPPTEWLPPGAWGSTRGHSILKQHAQQSTAAAAAAATAAAATASPPPPAAAAATPQNTLKGGSGPPGEFIASERPQVRK